jgi:DNA-binding helix-hairpin-helix protein with protein kinase domain
MGVGGRFNCIGHTYLSLHWSPFIAVVALVLSYISHQFAPWSTQLEEELKRLISATKQIGKRLETSINEYNNPSDYSNYSKGVNQLLKYVHDFRRLPDEFERRRKLMEERIYNEQLAVFLADFEIEKFDIPAFGAAKKTALYNNGIRTAADISKLGVLKVPGIGPKNQQVLLKLAKADG